MRFTLHIQMNSSSESESESDSESVGNVLDEFTQGVQSLEPSLDAIERQLQSIANRAKKLSDTTEWLDIPMNPATKEVKTWCRSKGIGSKPSLREWVAAILQAAILCDCETRSLLLLPEDAAIWSNHAPSIPFFTLLRKVPTFFTMAAHPAY
jgi:hypothetical protein